MFNKTMPAMLCILLSIELLANSYAQEVQLTEEQKEIYQRLKLSIKEPSRVMVRSSISRQSNPNTEMGIVGRYVTYKNIPWQVYEGFKPITEEELYRETGYKELEQKVIEWRQANIRFRNNAAALCFGGTAATIGGVIMIVSENENTKMKGITLTTVSSIVALVGYSYWRQVRGRLKMNRFRYETIKHIPDEYNQRLLIRIQREF